MHGTISNDATKQALLGITIPPCPASLTSIMREANKPSVSMTTLAQFISRDAGVVGPLLKMANSPMMGLRNKVTSVFQAVSVLGMQSTLNLVQNISLRQSMSGGSQSFDKFWERSSLEATIAEKIAAKFPLVSRDDAYLTSLFHDSGIPVLMRKHPDYREIVMTQCKEGKSLADVENDVFFTSHTMVGNMLTRSWMLPPNVCQAILHHHDATIFKPGDGYGGEAVCALVGIIQMTECIADEYLNTKDREWHLYENEVLKHFDMSKQEFFELKQDILAFLNGE